MKANCPALRLEEGATRTISMVVTVLIALGRYAEESTVAKPPMSIARSHSAPPFEPYTYK